MLLWLMGSLALDASLTAAPRSAVQRRLASSCSSWATCATCGDTEAAFGSMTFVGMSGTCAGALSMISAAVPGGLDAA
eukprot:2074108-Prymnesium_polylepis.1